jgi:arsenate reductase
LQHGADIVEERDFFQRPFTEDELLQLIGKHRVAEVFSWKSPSARALGIQPGQASDDELVRLMLGEPRLIRRPLIVANGELVIGFDQQRLLRLLS